MGKRANKRDAVVALRLQPGAHDAPRNGVCVVELASLLAGERFSDRPRCVCEVIAAFLRSWNDRSGYADRQRLAPYSARIIGTRARRETTSMRRDLCLAAAGVDTKGNVLRRLGRRLAARLRIFVLLGLRPAIHLDEGAGELAARVIFARQDEEAAFSLLDRLLAVGKVDHRGRNGNGSHPAVRNGNGSHPAHRNGNGNGSEAAALANPVSASAQERVATAVRELARDAEVPDRQQRRNGRNGNCHAGHVPGRDPGQGDEEHIEHHGSRSTDPERDPNVPQHLHAGKS